jgi:DNA (cytosine-5)-methyltransferase 1
MGVWMTFTESAKYRAGSKIDLLTEPCPTIQALGIGGVWTPQAEIWSDGGSMTQAQIDFMKNKPPYRVPLMAEINKLPWNGRTVVTTFAGGGGSSTGYKMAGYRVLWANEFIEEAQRTYKANHPKTIVDGRDIKIIRPYEILEACGLQRGELDIFDGSPPCQGFSLANKNRMTGKAKTYENGISQTNEQLFFAYVGLIRGLAPKVFVAENVKGLTVGKAKSMLGDFNDDMFDDQDNTILRALMDCGYTVRYVVLNAADHGTPQSRPRVIFVGVRQDLVDKYGVEPVFPRPLGYRYSVADACPWIYSGTVVSSANERHVAAGRRPADDATQAPAPTITTQKDSLYIVNRPPPRIRQQQGHFNKILNPDEPLPTVLASQHNQFVIEPEPNGRLVDPNKPAPTIMACAGEKGGNRIPLIEIPKEATFKEDGVVGKAWDKLEPGENDPKNFSIVKAHPDRPAPTITACGAWQLHPFEKRKFTIEEIKRLGGFPDDYVLTGKYGQQWERVGNSVPPPLMYHISSTILKEIFSKVP